MVLAEIFLPAEWFARSLFRTTWGLRSFGMLGDVTIAGLTIERKENGMPRKTTLRLLIILTILTSIPSFWLSPSPSPAEVLEVRARVLEALNASGLSNLVMAIGLAALLTLIAFFIGFIGLWWCKRWARFLFTIGTALFLPLGVAMSIVLDGVAPPSLAQAISPSSQALISKAILATADTTSPMLLGAILALTWFGMPREFE